MSQNEPSSSLDQNNSCRTEEVEHIVNNSSHGCTRDTKEMTTSNVPRRNFAFSSQPTLEDIRRLQDDFCKERNWDQYHQPRNLLLALVGEVGELAELFQWRGEVKEGIPDWTPEDKEHLGQELGDVLIYLVRLADKCQIDLPKAAQEKIKLNKLKYPTQQVWGSSKKYSEYQ